MMSRVRDPPLDTNAGDDPGLRARSGEPGRAHLLLPSFVGAIAWASLNPVEAFAWGPGTHIAVGEAVIASLHILPIGIQAVLRRYRTAFLYGSVAADISFAKKYTPVIGT